MKITSSRITTLLTIGENLNIGFKRVGDGPKADTFESVCAFLNKAGGVRNLYHYVKIYSNAEPFFDEDDVFRLTVPLDDSYSADRAFEGSIPRTKTTQETTHETVEKTVEKILSAMRGNPSITQQQLVEAIGLSRRGIEWQLNQLKAKGIIRRVGPDKGGHWEVIG